MRTHGFNKDSFEAFAVTKAESFWQFKNSYSTKKWLSHGGVLV
jgi:hypothetical protein